MFGESTVSPISGDPLTPRARAYAHGWQRRRTRGQSPHVLKSAPTSGASRREPVRVGCDVLRGGAQLLRRVDRQPEAFVPVREQLSVGDELRKRRRLVVAALGEAFDRLLGEDVDPAVDPVRDPTAFAESLDDVPVAEVDDAEG